MRSAAALSSLEAAQRVIRLLRVAVQPLGPEERRLLNGLLDELVMFVDSARLALERGEPLAEPAPQAERSRDDEADDPFSERPTVRMRLRALLSPA